jgi:folate-binding protein YgfZ
MLSPTPTPFKDELAGTCSGLLAGYSLLACSGADATAFLQAQTMNDLRALVPGQWQWNGWLNPKGRVICLFALWRRSEQDYLALLPDFPASELQPLLQRYVFRSKLRLAVAEDLAVAGSFDAAAGAGARDHSQAQGEGWRFDFGGESLARSLLLLPRDCCAPPESGFEARWRDADLAHGLPRLDPGQREAWTPQMLSLQRLNAFSLSKGCYPGQEIVARTHYLGQAKRELVLLAGDSISAGAAVAGTDGRSLGTVVSVGAEGHAALAVLQAEREPGPHRVGDALVREAPLQQGLQRPA